MTASTAVPAHAAPVGDPETIASGLAVPWDVLALPDGRILVTERSERRIRVIEPDGSLRAAAAWSEPLAMKVLGMDRHPAYAANRWIYVYVTYSTGSKVLRLVDDGTSLVLDRVIFDRPIATDGDHDGGRIRFGPDGKLYVTTGDVHDPALPRDLSKLNGKILRLNDDGSAPPDNPFASRDDDGRYVWSSGHRHPQGIAWDATGRMWASEHGPSSEAFAPPGETSGNDEINLIVPGGDYGWPQSSGAIVAPGTRPPVWYSGDVAVAPGGLAFAPDGRLYAPMLNGKHLRVFRPEGDTVVDEGALFPGVRLRGGVMLGCSLVYSTDRQRAASDDVLRIPISDCPPPATDTDTDTGTDTGTGTPPTPPADTPSADPPPVIQPSAAVASQRVLVRARRLLRRLGLRRLATRSRLQLRVEGYGPGRLVARIRRKGRLVASGRVTLEGPAPATLILRTTRDSRAKLRRLRRAGLRVVLTFRPRGGAPATWSRTVRVRPRGRL